MPNDRATVDMLGAEREVSLRLTPSAVAGDYVLVHAGFTIEVIDAQEAAETIEILRDLDELESAELAGASAPVGA